VSAALLLLGLAAGLVARRRLRAGPTLFAATLEELAKDRAQFGRRR